MEYSILISFQIFDRTNHNERKLEDQEIVLNQFISKIMKIPRRKFIKYSTIAMGALPYSYIPKSCTSEEQVNKDLDVHIFSKHLQFLDYESVGGMAQEMGFTGVDLTVRPKGHVLPEDVKAGLPDAIDKIEKGGSKCKLITTTIESTSNPLDRAIIEIAGKAGVEAYRANWFKYKDGVPMAESLEFYRGEIKNLSELNKTNNIIGSYQNHAGKSIGASFWEINKILESANPDYFGTQYDIRHAIAEGGHSWENGLRLLQKTIKVIVLKDFKWGKVNGKWKVINVPIGDGMVDFIKYFRLLREYQINVPVSLHLEYPLGGAEKGRTSIDIDQKEVYAAMMKDLNAIQILWKESG